MLSISIRIVDYIVRSNMKEDSEKELSVLQIVNQFFSMKSGSNFKKSAVTAWVSFWAHSFAKLLKTSNFNPKKQ